MFLPAILCISVAGAPAAPATPLEELLRAELAFAHRAEVVGYPKAFLETFAEEVVTFHPKPTRGRAFYAKEPQDRGRLRWYPSWAELSADGAFGFTSGPWEYLPEAGGSPATGHFHSVWRRSGGRWEVLLDVGVAHPPTALELPALSTPRELAVPAAPPAEPVADLDPAFTRDAAARGPMEAFAARGGRLRLLRSGEGPGRSLASRKAEFATLKGHAWVVEGSGAAASGDLAYTYGSRKDAAGRPQAVYVRFWRAEAGRWRLDLDLELPLKAE